MPKRDLSWLITSGIMGGGATQAQLYAARILATSPIAFWKLDETGGTTIVDSSGNGRNGTITGWDLANTASPVSPSLAPYSDGTNDFGNIYSASLGTAFNFDNYTLMIWMKQDNIANWTNPTPGIGIRFLRDGNNFVSVGRSNAANTMAFQHTTNAVTKNISLGSQSGLGWDCWHSSSSMAGGGLLGAAEHRAYKNAVEVGTVQTGVNAATGSGLSSTGALLGAATTTPTFIHKGWMAFVAVWNVAITTTIRDLGII